MATLAWPQYLSQAEMLVTLSSELLNRLDQYQSYISSTKSALPQILLNRLFVQSARKTYPFNSRKTTNGQTSLALDTLAHKDQRCLKPKYGQSGIIGHVQLISLPPPGLFVLNLALWDDAKTRIWHHVSLPFPFPVSLQSRVVSLARFFSNALDCE